MSYRVTELRPVHTGDKSRRKRRQKVSVSGDKWIQMDTFCLRFRRLLLPFQATFVAENGYFLSPFSATFVASVDRPLGLHSTHNSLPECELTDKGQTPLHQFPRSKSVTSWRRQKSVVSVVSCRFPNSITATSWSCQQVGSFPVYGAGADLGKKYLGAWPLIIWKATTAKRNYYRTN